MGGRGRQAVGRLELRVGYPRERPDPDFLSLRILIDGQELLTWAGPRGPYIGPWAAAVLGDDSPLIPAAPPRRVLLYFEGVPDPDESTITAVITAARRHVTWGDFRECRADSGDCEGTFGLQPPGSTVLDVPDLIFDREQYLDEVQRAIAGREWESDRWRTALLLDEYLRPGRPWSTGGDFYPAYAEPAGDDGSVFLVTLWDGVLRRGVVVSLAAGPGTPEQRARSMAETLMATPTDRWLVVHRMERAG